MNTIGAKADPNLRALVLMIAALLVGLPIAAWLDLSDLAEANVLKQASDLNSIISGVRGYYASNVVGRILSSPGSGAQVLSNYESVHGAIPIPARLSLDLGRVISERQQNIDYRFISDFPFAGRSPHKFDAFESESLSKLRSDSSLRISEVSRGFSRARARFVVPIIMDAACVACHNASSDSPKHDWKVGDVRGIQEVSISQPIAANLFSFEYLLMYFLAIGAMGAAFIRHQLHQTSVIRRVNSELEHSNEFLASLSFKISRYLSPQIYKSIFSGQKDAAIQTERKKLTIFFSDIKDFTAITERLQPELVTKLLNEYFTAMSEIAQAHGGTVDKFIGDAILIFFGDPETKGETEDAKACLRMAFDMQKRLAELNVKWRHSGVEEPLRVRMGVSTGFCNVGNFGSADRMQYTIIGAEANLAARLQSIADPGQIVISFETYSAVRDMLAARGLTPIRMKGISREVTPYAVEGLFDSEGKIVEVFAAHMAGVDFYLDPSVIAAESADEIRAILQHALVALDQASPSVAPSAR
ncbi:MAG TPA: adenylate/guanylate cyclase domain-containing protein [Roseiarcus sp.]